MVRKLADTVQLKLRFPERLRRQIEQAAERNRQSMNTEIIERLERSFQKVDDVERDRRLIQETVDSTVKALAQYSAEGAQVVNLNDAWKERLKKEASTLIQETVDSTVNALAHYSAEGAQVVDLWDAFRERQKKEASAALNKETKSRTGTGDKS